MSYEMSIFFGYINVLCHGFTFHIPNIAFYYISNLLPVALLYHILYFTHSFTLQKEPFFMVVVMICTHFLYRFDFPCHMFSCYDPVLQ